MTVLGVTSQTFLSGDRRWLAEDHGTEIAPGVPLDLTLFNQAQHYPNGYLPDGIVLGKVTATGKYGPYLDAASDGRQTAVGITLNPVPVYQVGTITGQLNANVGVAIVMHCFVNTAYLPFNSTNQALGGYIDAAGQVDLKNIIFLSITA